MILGLCIVFDRELKGVILLELNFFLGCYFWKYSFVLFSLFFVFIMEKVVVWINIFLFCYLIFIKFIKKINLLFLGNGIFGSKGLKYY